MDGRRSRACPKSYPRNPTSPPRNRGASAGMTWVVSRRATRRRATANGSGPAAGPSRTATGSAVRYVQRAFRPGRALSSSASPGRSRNCSATSIARCDAMRSGRRRSRTVAAGVSRGVGPTGITPAMIRPLRRMGGHAGPSRPAAGRHAQPSRPAAGRYPARMRARDLGITIGRGVPGPFNAITDVAGVTVGHTTLDQRRRAAGAGRGPGADRRDRHLSAGRGGLARTRLRGLPPAQRQRRAHGSRVGPRIGPADDADRDHQHAQRGRRARRARGGLGPARPERRRRGRCRSSARPTTARSTT